ncbi:hypothetical protein [Streptomyces sp. NPDC057686]|uniref:hypothetical protein n=1 Tax=Streptomyces sp. NPDC057686 TaxID=3346212 RepID=UPI00368CD754
MKSLTAQAAIDGIDEELARTTDDPERQLTALRARARMQLAAGDPAQAVTSHQVALDLLTALPHLADPSLAARLSEQAALLRVRARARAAPDYGRRPFGHPYHWAPFVLHGDWS